MREIEKTTTFTIPQVLISIIYSFLLNVDNWMLNNDGNFGILVSPDKRIAMNMSQVYGGIVKKNIKGNNVILSNCYDNIRRICYSWTIKYLSSFCDIENRWEIGIEGLDIGFYGMNQDGFPVTRSCVEGLPRISYYHYARDSHLLHLDVKRVKYGDLLQIKIHFVPESPNTFDVAFHKNGGLFFEFRSIICGDKLSLSLNFLRKDSSSIIKTQNLEPYQQERGFAIIDFVIKD